MPPRVSLLIPCYNAETYLPRLLKSVRAQTRPFDEILCYDDGSTDRTRQVILELGLILLTGDGANKGPGHARNKLAEAATGDWLHFHDADDLMSPGFLEETLALADADTAVVLCDSDWVHEDTRELMIHWSYPQTEYTANSLAYVLSHPVGVITALIRRASFLRCGGFDTARKCWEDADLFVRLAETGARFRMVEKTLVSSLRNDKGVSRDQHYCDHCRLEFLRDYARRMPASLRPALETEAEALVGRFMLDDDRAAAREAYELCLSLGGNPPATKNPVLRVMKALLPPLLLMKLQASHRRKAKSRQATPRPR